jgi:hypothetical protein
VALIRRDPVQFLDLRRGYLDCAVVIMANASGTARTVLQKLQKRDKNDERMGKSDVMHDVDGTAGIHP